MGRKRLLGADGVATSASGAQTAKRRKPGGYVDGLWIFAQPAVCLSVEIALGQIRECLRDGKMRFVLTVLKVGAFPPSIVAQAHHIIRRNLKRRYQAIKGARE